MGEAGRTCPNQRLWTRALGLPAFLGFLAALLAYGGFLAYTTVVSFDVVNLHRDAFFDDAFYYFEIAKNLAAGNFSTFDGGITRTNGYHPAWLLLVTPFYWVLDPEVALFGIRALEIMLIAGAVCLLALAVREARLPWILLFAVLPALYGQRGMMMGMEAAAGVFFLGATMLAAVLFARDAARWRWLLAGVAFLLPWVRFEYAAIALLVTGGLALLVRLARGAGWPLGRFSAARLRAAGMPFAATVAGVVVYLLYNGVVFGGVLPVSGAAKIAMSAHWTGPEGVDWRRTTSRFFDAAGRDGVAVAELCVYLLAVWGVCRRWGWSKEKIGLLVVLGTVLAFGVENLVVRAQVALLYHPRIDSYIHWYYVPGYLVAALMVPLRCYVAIFLLRRFLPVRWVRWRRLAVVAVCAAGIGASFDRYGFTEPFRLVDERRHAPYVMHSWGGLAQELVAFERLLPDDAVLGSWNAGAIGYFADRPVVNLDGVVSSYEYMRADPDKWGLWRERGGFPTFGVTHLAASVAGDAVGGRIEYVGSRALGPPSLKLWRREQAPSSKPWRSITSPSVGVDGERTGYRVIRHGRLVQVFVADCVHRGPGANLPEMLAFTWREGAQSHRETRLWAQPQRTELGYCAMRFLLPHGAETAAEILIDGTTVDRVVAGARPLLRSPSGVAVHGVQNRLLYVREVGEASTGCRRAWEDRYFLHLYPAAKRDLAYRRQVHGFVDYGRDLTTMRRRAGGRCVAEVALPAFRIREALTGEVVQGRRTWQARLKVDAGNEV